MVVICVCVCVLRYQCWSIKLFDYLLQLFCNGKLIFQTFDSPSCKDVKSLYSFFAEKLVEQMKFVNERIWAGMLKYNVVAKKWNKAKRHCTNMWIDQFTGIFSLLLVIVWRVGITWYLWSGIKNISHIIFYFDSTPFYHRSGSRQVEKETR